MPTHPNLPASLQELGAHLAKQAILDSRRRSFDMDDSPTPEHFI
jgi:hypothetical protein